MRRVDILRGKLEKLVGLLTEKKIKVTQRGTDAYVKYDAKTNAIEGMNIPYIPDNADDKFMDAIEGYVDHECGHILFTEPHHMNDARRVPYLANIFNAVEDSYIERMMAEKFVGSKRNLGKTAELIQDDYIVPEIKKGSTEMDMARVLFMPAIRSWAGCSYFGNFMKDKWHLIPTFVNKLEAYAKSALPNIKSTKESFEVAKQILTLLSDTLPEAEEQPTETGNGDYSVEQGDEVDGGEAPNNNEANDDDKKQGKSKKSNTEKSEDDNEDGEGNGADNGSEQQDENGDKSKSGKGKTDSDSDGEDSEDGEKSGHSEPSMLDKMFGGKDSDDDFTDALKKHLKKKAKNLRKDYSVFTTEFDEFVSPHVPEGIRATAVASLEESVGGVLGVVQKKLERAISAKSMAVWSGGYRSGKINATALSRLVVKQDDRVFKRKHISNTKDTAVTLLIDCSGSMSVSDRIGVASKTAYALSAVLERMNIKNEILGFTTGRAIYDKVRNDPQYRDYDWTHSRAEILRTYKFKVFDEKLGFEQKRRLASASAHYIDMSNNVDGESLMIAANRLLQRKEARKILIVLSDGLPNAYGRVDFERDLRDKAKYIENETPIDLVAIGIDSDAVRQFYKNYVLLDDVKDLPTTCLDQLQKLLLK